MENPIGSFKKARKPVLSPGLSVSHGKTNGSVHAVYYPLLKRRVDNHYASVYVDVFYSNIKGKLY